MAEASWVGLVNSGMNIRNSEVQKESIEAQIKANNQQNVFDIFKIGMNQQGMSKQMIITMVIVFVLFGLMLAGLIIYKSKRV